MKYQELTVWKKSMDLVDRIYDLSVGFPRDEKLSLIHI